MTDQFDLFEGKRLRDAGMEEASEAQDADVGGWSGRACEAIIAVARRQDTVHVDDVLAIFPERPHHPNAWGSVWARCIRNGIIYRSTETRLSRDRRKHAHCYPIYCSTICK